MLLGVGAAVSLLVGFFQWREKERLAAENLDLRSMTEVATAAPSTAPQTIDKGVTEAERGELLRLRSEVTQLQEKRKELEKLRSEVAAAKAENARLSALQVAAIESKEPAFVDKGSWHFAGYSSPETALQSVIYSVASGDMAAVLASLTPKQQEQIEADIKKRSKEAVTSEMRKEVDGMSGFRILGREASSTDERVKLSVEIYKLDGTKEHESM